MITGVQVAAFSDSENGSSVSLPETIDPCPPDVEALRRLSDNLGSLFQSPEFGFCADAIISVGQAEFGVHRCVLSARSPLFRDFFARKGRTKVELKELVGDFEVGAESFALVLEYLYSGRVGALPKGVCMCADEECSHVGCRPLIDFMVEVLYVSFTFQISELVNLFKVSSILFI
ncbi:Regulatory protein NPR2 [Dendrobium catenatum]|uniref:Regulatory protein NPR2 n=1 Tax=Dendrobium catenatum TaxID=906689 RepID=A0A2I0X389_9ASPA|nr:Regulatory protein NPR2 [Dendrobium catenatum]